MKKDDRVRLSHCAGNDKSPFWKDKNLDYNSIGTVTSASPYAFESRIIYVKWDNGEETISYIDYLRLYEEKNVPLPNLKFKRLGVD